MKTNEMGLMALVLFAAACFPPLHIKSQQLPDDTGIVDTDTGDSGETGNPCEEIDADGDGFSACDDCDDGNSEINPDAIEECTDLVDIDCDGFITGVDDDSDGVAECEDCDDAEPTAYPGNTEVCDGIDNDCNGDVDGDAVDMSTWYADTDSDGYGEVTWPAVACEEPAGYVADYSDCNDADATIYPGAPEVCESLQDMNCDGFLASEDGDGDGFAGCEECNDSDMLINPDATEVCNAIDDDCDGTPDDGLPSFTFYADTDGDGYGDPATTVSACSTPTGYVAHDGDCDDTDATINPGAAEDCAATDDLNCDGLVGADDNDGDSFSACEECNDADATINPGATEVCGDGTDNDCNGVTDTDAADFVNVYVDNDGDGYGDEADPGYPMCGATGIEGYVEDNTDCDDSVAAVNPGGLEVCGDGTDNDCDGTADESDCESGDTGDTGDTGPVEVAWYETDFGDGGACGVTPFAYSTGSAAGSYSSGSECGVYSTSGGTTSSPPSTTVDASFSGLTSGVTYTVTMNVQNNSSSASTAAVATWCGGSPVSVSLSAGASDVLSLSATASSSCTLQVWGTTNSVRILDLLIEDY